MWWIQFEIVCIYNASFWGATEKGKEHDKLEGKGIEIIDNKGAKVDVQSGEDGIMAMLLPFSSHS